MMPRIAPPLTAPQPTIGLDAFQIAGPPAAEPHFGHAPSPWVRSTFSATAICCSREAIAGDPTPPLAAQVAGLNCRPPYMPLPVFVDQLPPDSHWAIASQSTESALAVA